MDFFPIPNFSRYLINKEGTIISTVYNPPKKLKQYLNHKGYPYVCIYNDNKIRKTITVHRLVASTFIPNPNNLPEIDHIDGNKLNNSINNLEWVTSKENLKRAWIKGQRIFSEKCKENRRKATIKPVLQFDKKGNFIKEWPSMQEAAKAINVAFTAISAVCRKYRHSHTAGGFIWRFKDE